MNNNDKRICLGAFAGAHGVKGEAKIKTFTGAPESIAAYGVVETEDRARKFTLKLKKILNDGIALVSAPEIASREDAESLKGVRLYVDRSVMPAPGEDEFYLDDLAGLAAFDETGAPMGVVKAVYNFGADDLLELGGIPGVKGVRLVPFTKANVPEVDLTERQLTVLREALAVEDGEEPPDAL
jgi:16S rRNA processing protein RimM